MSNLSDNEYLFTSESVTEGHPDKIADQISDGVLDAVMADDPRARRCETLVTPARRRPARLDDDARALAEDPEAPPVFSTREVAGVDTYSLRASDGFAPTYAVAGKTVVVATAPAGGGRFLAKRGPRLKDSKSFRAAIPLVPPRTESLGFFDVRQLLTLGEQTGLTAEDLHPVRAASAVIQREGDDTTTAELFFEIP